ncbi:hypothetical protein SSPS47_11275 [Streptomyces sp. S4.7]|uniref:DUF397 domain-containing protein n=1 Tax=Streptomyces sp. S4.7 TaxID=2705439 RepID=UPI001396E870|nr:DUF397 domain-containing protein [Streptomyces sp. S4.7]QHY95699.1 hypothetical protein SSPS47_11275 [Streptomyces sp. S4.7]
MTSSPTESQWRKSSYSNGAGGECVEVAAFTGNVGVRDSKVLDGERLAVPHSAWAEFVTAVRHQELG